jgi:hypothetical protein
MVVAFTPNIALAKPSEDELALELARASKLYEDNNIIIMSETDNISVAYTPVITAQTTPPNLGTGTVRGEYQEFLGFIFGQFTFDCFDPGITVGSGEYGISLPFPADPVYHAVGTALNATPGPFSVIGEGQIWDNSNTNASGLVAIDVVTVGGVSYARMLTEAHTVPVKTSRIFRDSMPFALAVNDRAICSFFYKKV